MNNRNKTVFIAIIVFIIAGAAIGAKNIAEDGKYDAFAKCLTDKGVKLFGAYWCPHCQDQKAMFKGSFKYINYTECAIEGSKKQTEACSKEGIASYPTWKYADGTKESRVKSLDELSKISGCAL